MTITAKIEKIIYRNEENFFTVLNVVSNDEFINVIGYFPEFVIGEEVEFIGQYVRNNYGYQFSADDYNICEISEKNDVINFLSSGVIKGIGLNTAKQIVEYFGDNTLEIFSNAPYRLTEVKGIGDKKAEIIIKSYNEIVGDRQTIFELQKIGFTPKESLKIANYYGKDATKYISQNPYILIDDIDGIGFTTADKIAIKMGFSKSSEFRIKSAVKYYLNDLSNSLGHTCYPKDDLIHEIKHILDIDDVIINDIIDNMLYSISLKKTQTADLTMISTPYFYNLEKEIAVYLTRLKSIQTVEDYSDVDIKFYDSLDKRQIEAINATFNNPITIITGGPGTGKTTIINHILKLNYGKKIALCAPTGRAAKRISESAGIEAFTIHKLLEYGFGDNLFNKNEDNKLECDLIIVDEMSMVDEVLFCSLLRALPSNCRIILIGDEYQLPSVGPGNLLKDLIRSELIPYVQLKKVYRQKNKSLIIENSSRIKNGKMPILDNSSKDFFFIETSSAKQSRDIIIDLFTKRLPKYLNIDEHNIEQIYSKIQILSPTKKAECGTIELNNLIQNLYKSDDPDDEFVFAGHSYYVGDKIIQIKNDYEIEYKYENSEITEKGIFNGELGRIIEIIDKELIVRFEDGKIVKYTSLNIDNISLAYCLTVHKSQGSEFPIVIIPIVPGSKLLLTRNLLYTAITRAKDMVVLVGSKNVLNNMINNNYIAKRYTLLKELISNF